MRSQARRLAAVAAGSNGNGDRIQADQHEAESGQGGEEARKVPFTPEAVANLRSLVGESAEMADRELAAAV